MKKKYIESSILIGLVPIQTLLLLYGIYNTNINYKILIPTISIIITISLITIIRLYLSKKISKYNISQFISLTLNILLLFNIYNINNQYDYIQNSISNKYVYNTNNLIVLKNTKYRNIKHLNKKKIGILESNYKNSKEILSQKLLKTNYISYKNKESMISALKNGEIQGILLNDNDFNILKSNKNTILKETRSIHETKIKSEI